MQNIHRKMILKKKLKARFTLIVGLTNVRDFTLCIKIIQISFTTNLIVPAYLLMFNQKRLLTNSSEFLNTLNIIFYLMVGIPLTLFCVTYLKLESQDELHNTNRSSFNFLLHVLLPLVTILCVILAYTYNRKLRKQIKAEVPLQEKLLVFYHTSIIKYGMLFAANIFPVVGLYLTREQLFAGLYSIALVAFSLTRPTLHRIIKDLRLDKNERENLIHTQNLNES